LTDDQWQWVLALFTVCQELALHFERLSVDDWHPLIYYLAFVLRKEAEALAIEQARSKHR
jgi:hypothetical protein